MAGVTTPAMTAAVTNAGGLGTYPLAAGLADAEQLRPLVANIRAALERPGARGGVGRRGARAQAQDRAGVAASELPLLSPRNRCSGAVLGPPFAPAAPLFPRVSEPALFCPLRLSPRAQAHPGASTCSCRRPRSPPARRGRCPPPRPPPPRSGRLGTAAPARHSAWRRASRRRPRRRTPRACGRCLSATSRRGPALGPRGRARGGQRAGSAAPRKPGQGAGEGSSSPARISGPHGLDTAIHTPLASPRPSCACSRPCPPLAARLVGPLGPILAASFPPPHSPPAGADRGARARADVPLWAAPPGHARARPRRGPGDGRLRDDAGRGGGGGGGGRRLCRGAGRGGGRAPRHVLWK
jgi:hypothetical protein